MVNPSIPVVPGIPNYGLPGSWPGKPFPDDLVRAHYMPGDYLADPCTALLDAVLVVPRGFYAVVTHYACRITASAQPVSHNVTLEVQPAGCDGIYPIVGLSKQSIIAAESTATFEGIAPIVLDEMDTLWRRVNQDVPDMGGLRVVFVNKGGEL